MTSSFSNSYRTKKTYSSNVLYKLKQISQKIVINKKKTCKKKDEVWKHRIKLVAVIKQTS